jgi:hypothetical protein
MLYMKRAPVRASSSIAALAPQSPKKSSRSPRDFKDRALSMAEKEWSVARGRKNESNFSSSRQLGFCVPAALGIVNSQSTIADRCERD